MTSLQKIRERVIAVNPEIVELNRNCMYRRKSIKGRWFDHILDHPTSFEFLCGCTKGQLTTQAFTTFRCGLCKQGKSWRNGAPPKWCLECAENRSVCPYCKAKLEIIGRPITIADILLAVKKSLQRPHASISEDDGDLSANYHDLKTQKFSQVVNAWDLKDDNLEHQSPETLEFLAKVLEV